MRSLRKKATPRHRPMASHRPRGEKAARFKAFSLTLKLRKDCTTLFCIASSTKWNLQRLLHRLFQNGRFITPMLILLIQLCLGRLRVLSMFRFTPVRRIVNARTYHVHTLRIHYVQTSLICKVHFRSMLRLKGDPLRECFRTVSTVRNDLKVVANSDNLPFLPCFLVSNCLFVLEEYLCWTLRTYPASPLDQMKQKRKEKMRLSIQVAWDLPVSTLN